MTQAATLHKLLLDKAAELNLPQFFHRDLTVHDLAALTEAPEDQLMLWGIGECGTHMIRLRPLESPDYWAKAISGCSHWFVLSPKGMLDPVSAVATGRR